MKNCNVITVLFFLASFNSVHAQKNGDIRSDTIRQSMPEYKQMMLFIDSLKGTRQKQLEEMYARYEKMQKSLQRLDEGRGKAESIIEKEIQDLNDMRDTIQNFEATVPDEINKAQEIRLKDINKLLAVPVFAQDPCFQQQIFSIDNYAGRMGDTAHPMQSMLKDYINSFIGCKAPDFEVTTIYGKNISSASLKGKVVVLNFWFTRCKPCVGEFPSLNKLVEEFAGKEVVFLSFAWDSAKVLDTFLVKHPLKYDLVAQATSIATLYKIGPYPTNMILNRDFKVVKIFDGGNVVPEKALENYEKIRPVIEGELGRY